MKTAASYFIVNTLMLGVCGVYDLFWWSILSEMLDLDKNPAKILGVGLSGGMFNNYNSAAPSKAEHNL